MGNKNSCQVCDKKTKKLIIRCWKCDYKINHKKKYETTFTFVCEECQDIKSDNFQCKTCFKIICKNCIDNHLDKHIKKFSSDDK
jgi:hypothetical protein